MPASTLQDLTRPANWPKMRPRFVVDVACEPGQVIEAMRKHTRATELPIDGSFSEQHGVFVMSEGARQFWSPQLGITIETAGSGSEGSEGTKDAGKAQGAERAPHATRVLGIFSPHPEIWTAYVFAIGTLAAIGVFGAMYAIVQLSLGHTPSALLAPLLAALVAGLLYTSTLVGQGLALGEMYQLRSHLDECLEEAETHARRAPRTSEQSAQL